MVLVVVLWQKSRFITIEISSNLAGFGTVTLVWYCCFPAFIMSAVSFLPAKVSAELVSINSPLIMITNFFFYSQKIWYNPFLFPSSLKNNKIVTQGFRDEQSSILGQLRLRLWVNDYSSLWKVKSYLRFTLFIFQI